ncbi:MAG TPA: hypothetical protein VNH82_06680 [Candidatus Dormibacteraeota bacterium]|nr:hypothetical protein [Candidatus Dormibacteraeota bacterium]
MDSCIACDLVGGRLPLPGGQIHHSGGWVVEHCVGPLGLGTLIVKPKRHVTAVADLTEGEARNLGPLLRLASEVAGQLVDAEQVYNCLWSHAGGVPGHLHYVIQPVTRQQTAEFESYGPDLQAAMFAAGQMPDPKQVEAVAQKARDLFAAATSSSRKAV